MTPGSDVGSRVSVERRVGQVELVGKADDDGIAKALRALGAGSELGVIEAVGNVPELDVGHGVHLDVGYGDGIDLLPELIEQIAVKPHGQVAKVHDDGMLATYEIVEGLDFLPVVEAIGPKGRVDRRDMGTQHDAGATLRVRRFGSGRSYATKDRKGRQQQDNDWHPRVLLVHRLPQSIIQCGALYPSRAVLAIGNKYLAKILHIIIVSSSRADPFTRAGGQTQAWGSLHA